MNIKKANGSLTCIGTGITLAGQITTLSKNYLEQAERVFGILPDKLSEDWVKSINPSYKSLQYLYAEGKSRRQTYQDMTEVVCQSVREGNKVVLALYGHPGIFACVGHFAIERLKTEGYPAQMLPGVSADACLYADLGIDPGTTGCQAYEATQFLFSGVPLNTSAYTILWQIGLAGEHTLKTLKTTQENLKATVRILNKWYPLQHEMILYEAPFIPVQKPRIDTFMLKELPQIDISTISTLVIPPLTGLKLDKGALDEFGLDISDFG
ncbi:SAM-dependent methyltransferase [Kangiella marina]|uniref:SAM-dependent methyltransferase n=1 Tax=Kangiella marina TaxID=1079178 RepID=A0ABP8ICY6_9GAMM